MGSPAKVHWRAPTIMGVTWLAGLAFAIGHHFFYRMLDGQDVDNGILSQQRNGNVGTAFSFLVRSALVTAVGAAFWQIFWGTLSRKTLELSSIDSLAGLLGNLLDLFTFSALPANPTLFALAALSWLIPFALFLPPATLTVSLVPQIAYEMRTIPMINWTDDSMAYQVTEGNLLGLERDQYFTQVSQPLLRSCMATAIRGEIPLIVAPAANSSYRLAFDGPAVRCAAASVDTSKGTWQTDTDYAQYLYVAWAGNSTSSPFEQALEQPDTPTDNTTLPTLPVPGVPDASTVYVGGNSTEPNTIFIAVNPVVDGGDSSDEPWTVLNCTLWDAVYSVDLNFTNASIQRVSMDTIQYKDLSYANVDPLNPSPDRSKVNYRALMEGLGRILVGIIYRSYAIMGREGGPQVVSAGQFNSFSDVLQTELALSHDLLKTYLSIAGQSTIANDTQAVDAAHLLNVDSSPQYNKSLGPMVEELFQNMTLALFSDARYLTTTNISQTNVTIETMNNIYVYSASRLWLAYGIALGVSFIAVVIAVLSLWRDKASYSNRFSTIVRATCKEDVSARIANTDRSGADPLPKYLETLQIRAGPNVETRAWDRPTLRVERKPAANIDESSSMLDTASSTA